MHEPSINSWHCKDLAKKARRYNATGQMAPNDMSVDTVFEAMARALFAHNHPPVTDLLQALC